MTLSQWQPDDVLKAMALAGAAIAFGIGLTQYQRAQKWKRAEWVAQEMKALFDDPIVQAALLMIDWGSRRIALYPSREKLEDRYVFLTNEMVARALMPHEDRQGNDDFSEQEADIRSAFDRTLDGLERFHSYVQTGLVQLGDLEPYLKYWAKGITRPSTAPPGEREDRLERLRVYMQKYGFDGALQLLRDVSAAQARRSTIERRHT